MVGLAMGRPLESNPFPALLDGLVGSLGMAGSGEGSPLTPTTLGGAGHAWSTAVCGTVSLAEQRDAAAPEALGLTSSLGLRFEETFLGTQRHLVPPVLSDPLSIPRMAKEVFELANPLEGSKVLPSAHHHVALPAPLQPESSGLKQGVWKPGKPIPSTSQPTPTVQEQISKASDNDSDETDEVSPEREPPRRSLKVKLPLTLRKRSRQTTASGSRDDTMPSKVRKELETEEVEADTPTGPSEVALQKARFKLFKKDLPEVQEVRSRIIKL